MLDFSEIVPGEVITISASAYGYYLQCPDRLLAHLQGNYSPPSVISFKGGLAHRLFAVHLTEGPIEEQDLHQVLKQEIGNSYMLSNDMSNLVKARELKPSELGQVFEEVGRLYERFCSYPFDGFQEAESNVEHELPGNVVLRGRVDACFESEKKVRLVDWKTGQLGDPLPQLHFYSMLWLLNREVMPHLVEAVSLKTGERKRVEVEEDDLKKTATQVVQLVNDARAAFESQERMVRDPGPLCRYCPILDSCSEGSAAVEILNIG